MTRAIPRPPAGSYPWSTTPDLDLLALDEALTKLSRTDKTKADLVQLRYFGGLTLAQAAQVLGISPATADRYWAYARAWMHQEITRTGPAKNTSKKPADA